jgi:hypothetical protein
MPSQKTAENMSPREALESLRQGIKAFQHMSDSLPRGVDEAVKGLRARVEELQRLVESAEAWEKKCPGAGKLMWVQISPAAGDEDPPEWALGQLFVSKSCLYFQANESPPWTVGPVMWDKVQHVAMVGRTPDQDGDFASHPCTIRMSYMDKSGGDCSIRLQISLVDMAWLEQALPSGVFADEEEASPMARIKSTNSFSTQMEPSTPKGISTIAGISATEMESFQVTASMNQGNMYELTASFYSSARDMDNLNPTKPKDPA